MSIKALLLRLKLRQVQLIYHTRLKMKRLRVRTHVYTHAHASTLRRAYRFDRQWWVILALRLSMVMLAGKTVANRHWLTQFIVFCIVVYWFSEEYIMDYKEELAE